MEPSTKQKTAKLFPTEPVCCMSGDGTIAIIVTAVLLTVISFVSIGTRQSLVVTIAMLLGVALIGACVTRFYQTMTIRADGETITYTSWMKTHTIALTELSSISLRAILVGRYIQWQIVFWAHNGRELGQIAASPFNSADWLRLFHHIRQYSTDMTIDRELERHLSNSFP